MAVITQQQFGKLLVNAPRGVTREQLIAELEKRGHMLPWNRPLITSWDNQSSGVPVAFPIEPGKESFLSNSLKTLGNLPGSTVNFVKNTLWDIPKQAVQDIASIPENFKQGVLKDANGNVGEALLQTAKNLPGAALEVGSNLIPGFIRQIYNNDLEGAQKTLAEDPFGQIAPIVLAARGIAEKAGVGAKFDSAISSIAKPITEPIRIAGEKIGSMASKGTKFATSQVTGLNPETVSTIVKNPYEVETALRQGISRQSIASEVESALQQKVAGMDKQVAGFTPKNFAQEIKTRLDERIASLEDVGKNYEQFRADKGFNQPLVKVSPTFLEDTIKKYAGVDIKDGKIIANTSGRIRDARDIRALQNIHDLWNPQFKAEALTSNEFLNLRSDLSKLAKFERDVGKSTDLESIAGGIRKQLNDQYRSKINGLDKFDKQYEEQISSLTELKKGLIDNNGDLLESAISKIANAPKNDLLSQRLEKISPGIVAKMRFLKDIQDSKAELMKGLLDKDGNLTESAINKIANSSGEGKSILQNRLEEISPGITAKVKLLKVIEDIKNASGQKVGTYSRAGLFGAASVTVNPMLIIGAIMSVPEIAVPLLKGVGMAMPKIKSTLKLLEIPIKAINNAPDKLFTPLNQGNSQK